jgi:hypothetical protein
MITDQRTKTLSKYWKIGISLTIILLYPIYRCFGSLFLQQLSFLIKTYYCVYRAIKTNSTRDAI